MDPLLSARKNQVSYLSAGGFLTQEKCRKQYRCFDSPKFCFKLLIFSSLCMFGAIYYFCPEEDLYPAITRKTENLLKEQLKFDIGTGCVMPYMDPFGEEARRNDNDPPRIICNGTNWVKCYLSKCKVVNVISHTYKNISCAYRDIIFHSDFLYNLSRPVKVMGDNIYHLKRSDHVNVTCTGFKGKGLLTSTWSGNLAGFRSTVHRKNPPKGRKNTINILIFAFDSSARIRFIRRMPKSYKYLTEDLQATILNSYNIVGDGTKEILTVILTGKTLYELPSVLPGKGTNTTCDVFPFIFYKLRDDGYRTAFLEDGPDYGTYMWDSNGFQRQPTDHYLTAFNTHNRLHYYSHGCLGDTPQHKVMMNLSHQFMHLDGKKFIFTLVGDISHNDYNLITNADDDFVEFLRTFKRDGLQKDTLLLVMGDHGPRFGVDRSTPQAQLEERLPLMAIVLPERLKAERPDAHPILQQNANSLTTPYDIHATLLDAVGLRKYWNGYKIPGASHLRGMTILEPIPLNRSCSEAGVTPHYCACLVWHNVSQYDRLYSMASVAFVDYINLLIEPVRTRCRPRTLASTHWVKTLRPQGALEKQKQIYQVKVTVDSGATFEATLTYLVKQDEFEINIKDISRTSRYGSEPACIEKTHPHLRFFCLCYDYSSPNTGNSM